MLVLLKWNSYIYINKSLNMCNMGRVGKMSRKSGQRVDKEWTKNGQIVNKEWAKCEQAVGAK